MKTGEKHYSEKEGAKIPDKEHLMKPKAWPGYGKPSTPQFVNETCSTVTQI